MKKGYVITGIGVTSSIGCSVNSFWHNLCSANSGSKVFAYKAPDFQSPDFSTPIDSSEVSVLDSRCLESKICVKRVPGHKIAPQVSPRLAKKIDKFSLFALDAYYEAKLSANLSDHPNIIRNSGLVIGNSTGGWEYVEQQLYGIYNDSLESINPYVATAWFPTAAQGEISILDGVSGYSKTLSAGNASVGYCLQHAMLALESNQLHAAFIIGCEAPITPLVINACLNQGIICDNGRYYPYSSDADGGTLSEGAGAFTLEKEGDALKRNACVLAKVLAVESGVCLGTALENCLSTAELTAGDIDLCILDGIASPQRDSEELEFVRNYLAPSTICSLPSIEYGTTLAADFSFRIITSILCLKNQFVPCMVENMQEGVCIPKANKSHKASLRRALIYGRDPRGSCISVILETGD